MPQGFQPSTSNHSPIPKLPGLLNLLICIGSGKVQRASRKTKTVSSHLLLEDILKALRGCAGWQEDLHVPALPVDRSSPPSRPQLCPGSPGRVYSEQGGGCAHRQMDTGPR